MPKFREYLINNEAVLNNVLKYAKELGTMPSNATIDDISFEYKGYRIPYGYYKCLGDFGMFKPNGEASPIETLSLKDYNFNEAVDFFSDAKTLRRNEILQQIANGEERERYRNSDMTTAEIAQEVQNKRNAVVESVVTGKYKDILNKRMALADENKKITAGMSDDERYEILKSREIPNIKNVSEIPDEILKKIPDAEKKIPEITSWNDINKYLGSEKRNIIEKIAEEFGIINKEYFNDDIQIYFEFSHNNFRETYKKQERNFVAFAKMFSVFQDVIESAVGVEVHNNVNHKFDPTLENVFVLMSAYQDGSDLVPIKLEVKKFKDKQNTLYVAVSLEKIKMTEVLDRGNTEIGVTQQPRSVNVSIANIFSKVNPLDKSFLKYIPDGFLNPEQLSAKIEAIKESNDKDYMVAVNRGDMETAQRMVDEAAREAGYSYKGYHGTKRGGFTVFKNRLPGMIEGLKSIFLAKDEGTAGQYAYGGNRKIYSLYARMDNPFIVDCGHSEATDIYTGNKPKIRELARKYLRDAWETFSPTDNLTTDQIGYLVLRSGEYDGVIFKNVNDSYTNRRVTDVYEVFEPEQIKSADPVTYDDNGNVIPLSERFNTFNPDIRYALTDADIADGSIERLQRPSFKEKVAESFKEGKENFVPGIVATEIQLTNAQAGIEHTGRRLGMKNVESLVQRCRASRAIAQEMLGGGQWAIAPNATKNDVRKLGDGLEQRSLYINGKEREK